MLKLSIDEARGLIGQAWPDRGFAVTEELGSGSFGRVYRVAEGDDEYAVKVVWLQAERSREDGQPVSAGSRLDRSWRRVAEDHGRLPPQSVVGVHDYQRVVEQASERRAQGWGLVLMDLWPWNLLDWVHERSPVERGQVGRVLERVAETLEKLHGSEGWICEDLKPQNLLVRELSDGGLRVVVGDIGGLKRATASSSTVEVTPGWRAPEVRRGDRPDVASTVFAFGLIGFYVIEGRLPYGDDEDERERLKLLGEGGPDFSAELSEDLGQVRSAIAQCLRHERKDRPQSFAAVREKLRQPVATTKSRPTLQESNGRSQQGSEIELSGPSVIRSENVSQIHGRIPLENLGGQIARRWKHYEALAREARKSVDSVSGKIGWSADQWLRTRGQVVGLPESEMRRMIRKIENDVEDRFRFWRYDISGRLIELLCYAALAGAFFSSKLFVYISQLRYLYPDPVSSFFGAWIPSLTVMFVFSVYPIIYSSIVWKRSDFYREIIYLAKLFSCNVVLSIILSFIGLGIFMLLVKGVLGKEIELTIWNLIFPLFFFFMIAMLSSAVVDIFGIYSLIARIMIFAFEVVFVMKNESYIDLWGAPRGIVLNSTAIDPLSLGKGVIFSVLFFDVAILFALWHWQRSSRTSFAETSSPPS